MILKTIVSDNHYILWPPNGIMALYKFRVIIIIIIIFFFLFCFF